METKIYFHSTYHLELYGYIKRVNQILKDILRMYYTYQQTKWEDYLKLVGFIYNNIYQTSLKISLFEALYGIKYKTLIS